jgi:hypothetical protein
LMYVPFSDAVPITTRTHDEADQNSAQFAIIGLYV